MKKSITVAFAAAALCISIHSFAQPPAPGPGGPPHPGPRGAAGFLQPLTTFQGRVSRLSMNDDFIYDGFYLLIAGDSQLVKFPVHLGSQVVPLVKPKIVPRACISQYGAPNPANAGTI